MKCLDGELNLGKAFCSVEPITMMMGGSALTSAAGNIFSSIMGGSAAKKQADAIKEAAEINRRTTLELDDRQRADMAPFRNLGVESGSILNKIMKGETNLDDVLGESSLFKWQQSEGERSINRQLAARGSYSSGVGLETLARFNNQLVAEEGQRYWERLFNTMQLGSNAAARVASNTTALGGSLLSSQTQTGLAQAGSIGDATRSLASIGPGVAGPVASGLNSFMEYQLYNPILQSLAQGNRMTKPSGVMDEKLSMVRDDETYAFQP